MYMLHFLYYSLFSDWLSKFTTDSDLLDLQDKYPAVHGNVVKQQIMSSRFQEMRKLKNKLSL